MSAGILVANRVTLEGTRESTVKSVEANVTSQSIVLAEEVDRSFKALDLALSIVSDRIARYEINDGSALTRKLANFEMHHWLRDRSAGMPHVDAITIINDRGKLINFSRFWPIPQVDVSDRDYFKALKDDAQLETFVSMPVENRGSGTWTIYLARRLNTPDGEFMGLVLGAISLRYFEGYFKSISIQEGSAAALVREDGLLLAHYPQTHNIGRNVPFEIRPASGEQPKPHLMHMKRLLDGKDAIVSVRPLPHYPLHIVVSQTEHAALRDWWALAQFSNMAANGSALLILLLVGAAFFWWRKQEVFNQELEEKNIRFDMALANMGSGLCMFDKEKRLVVCNERFAQIYQLPPELLQRGTPLVALLNHRRIRGISKRTDLTEKIEAELDAMRDNSRTASVVIDELADGRVISITRQPMPHGGWVSTHEDITERRKSEERILHMARHDALTDLPNRTLLRERLALALKGSERTGRQIAVLMLDLDRFKEVNDTLGHPVGDELLKGVAARLKECVRETALIARLGGDEFAIIEEVGDPLKDAIALAERIRATLATPFILGDHQVQIGSSIGIAIGPQDGQEPDDLVKNSDLALYRAKSEGRGGHCFFEPEMDRRMQARRDMERALRQALGNDEFSLHFQPIVNLKSNEVTSCEALLRWHEATAGWIPPSAFIGLAEETGLIGPIGEWVVRRACQTAAGWPEHVSVAVNISATQFKGMGLVPVVISALAQSGLAPHRLEIEITESVLMEENEAAFATLRQLHAMGVRISLDDFGTGCSSLSHLRRFTFDKIKIDRSFVTELDGETSTSRAIVRSLIQLADSLGKHTTAEGVETQELADLVRQMGCTEMQGFFFSPPVPAAEIMTLIGTRPAVQDAA